MATIDDLTPERLTDLLADQISGPASVTSVKSDLVGTGQMAICARLQLDYSEPGAGPSSVVAKVPSQDPGSRGAAEALRCYEIEVHFYRDLHGELAVRTPVAYHAEVDVPTTDFLLLMEDVAPAAQGDQLAGGTIDQAAAAVKEMAGLHAPLWGDPRLEQLEWLHRNTEHAKGNLAAIVRGLYPGFVDRYADRLDPDIRRVSDELVAAIDTYEAGRPGPKTVTHGDFRLDNLLFDSTDPEVTKVYVVDWQTAVLGPGVSDLSYFLGSAFLPDQRRDYEEELVGLYHQGMHAAGVDLDWDDLWSQYRRYAFGGLIMAIAASMMVQRTERGDDMFMVMAHRHGQHAVDLASDEFL